ncbi:aldo/keto reductase [Rhizobium ruizarguesonis]|uniref:aldo/keto reductase n=1 Tax=Rhizobium ruizarguesonis TaxID=2081791 RepID=UPI0029624767|nr:aldo/keto reductase [Rhizobium ruizarguesonis]
MLPPAAELRVTAVPYSPLGRGMPTGLAFATSLTDTDARQHFPRFTAENLAANMLLVAKINIALARGVSAAQIALAWHYVQSRKLKVKTVPIPGRRKCSRLLENVAAESMILTAQEMEALAPLASV